MIYSDIYSFTPFIHSLPTAFKWTLPDPVLETVEPPVLLFEFFTDDITKLSVRNQSDMQSPKEIIVLRLILTC